MTSNDEDTDGAGVPTPVGVGPTDATTVVPTPPASVPELAWSQDDDTEEPGRQSWPVTWATGAVLILGAVILIAVVGIIDWAIRPSAQPRRPNAALLPTATSTVAIQAAPPPPTATVTVEAPPAVPKSSTETTTPARPLLAELSPDDRFISWLNADNMYPDDRNIAIHDGRAICAMFSQGKNKTAIIGSTKTNTGLPDFAATDFVSIAVNAFCPQYAEMLVRWGANDQPRF